MVSHFSFICGAPFKKVDVEGELYAPSLPFDGDCASKEGEDKWLLMQAF